MPVARIHHALAFTLVEILVATIVLALITGATTTAVSNLAKSKSLSASRQQATERAQSAAAMIATDAQRLVRDHDLFFTRLVIENDARGGEAMDDLLLLVRTIEPVRGLFGLAEGADFEVQYRIEEFVFADASGGLGAEQTLWRRVDPALDEYQTGGGVATMVGRGMIGLSIEASDGDEWRDEWDSDLDGLPYGLRITVTAQDDRGLRKVVARRVVAIDRIPLPIDTSEPEEGGE